MKLGSYGGVAVASLALAAIASAGIGTAPANAQELVRIPSLSYASDAEVSSLARTGFIISPDWSLSDEVSLGGTGGALLDDVEGWAIGAKLGYDQQVGNIVVGVITDGFYSFADGGGRGMGAGVFESDLNYYGTVRGRLGYSFGRLMAYGTAGYAYGDLEVKDVTTGAKSSEGLSGWTYGGGLEYFWNRDLNLHAGYRRIDFDDQTFSSLPTGSDTLSPEMDIIDFGLTTRY
ncbi:MAG: outer membrane beta-barrel protein [Hyphomicrobium sp.]|nr:outer membrane beta-barrel protein [Hyphomicrobium sp.]